MKIATLEFGGAESTMGLALVCSAVKREWPDAEIYRADLQSAKRADYLFVSLIWWRDVYAFVRFLVDAGIDPRKRAPHIVVGGMMMVNPRPIAPYWHTAIVGDGEECIVGVMRRLESGLDPSGLPGVWSPGGCAPGLADRIPAETYVDLRTNKTTRIEIARGCKAKCAFCELAFLKPYREQPFDIVRHLVLTAPTKTIAMFAPDRCSHSQIDKIESLCAKLGKTNTGSDTRLEMLRKTDVASKVRFGVEGFSERTRKKLHKITSNDELLEGMRHVALRLKTPKGKPHTMATLYLIGDLPGEGPADVAEFWGVLERLDGELTDKFTLFVSLSSFAPSPFTPMERCAIDPWTKASKWFRGDRPRYQHIVIATRGAVIQPPQRIAQMLTIRGDERASRAVHWLATKGSPLLKSTDPDDGKTVASAIESSGFPVADLWAELDDNHTLPWYNIERQVTAGRPWKDR